MTHAALSPLIGAEFDKFLGAAIGEDRNGTTLSVLSALARLDVDPWREARALARMPRDAAAERLSALIDALPSGVPSRTGAADLVALLPTSKTPQIRDSDSASGGATLPRTAVRIGLRAFVLMMLTVLAMLALISLGPEIGANRVGPRAASDTIAAP